MTRNKINAVKKGAVYPALTELSAYRKAIREGHTRAYATAYAFGLWCDMKDQEAKDFAAKEEKRIAKKSKPKAKAKKED